MSSVATHQNGEVATSSATPPRATKRRKDDSSFAGVSSSSTPPDTPTMILASSSVVLSSPPTKKTKVRREKSGSKPKEAKVSSSIVMDDTVVTPDQLNRNPSVSSHSHTVPTRPPVLLADINATPEGIQREKRMKLINEFMTSELLHVEALKTVVVDYVQPLRLQLPKETIKKLFGNIEVIMGWNMQFYGRLRARYEESEDMSVDSNADEHEFLFGDIMVEMLVILRQIYSQYNENYEEAQLTYRECMKNKDFEHHIRTTSNGRMIIYDSLLKEIIQLTPPGHADREDLVNAQKMIGAATRQASRVVDMRKNLHNVLRIQSMLQNAADIAEPHRRYVYEGTVVVEAGHKTVKERAMFLFNDLVIIAKPKRKKYEVEWSSKLSEVQLIDNDEDDRTRFQLKDSAGNDVSLASEEKPTWMYHIKAAIKNLGATPQELHALRIEEHLPDHLDGSIPPNPDRFHDSKHLAGLIIRWSELKSEDAIAEIRATAMQLRTLQPPEKM